MPGWQPKLTRTTSIIPGQRNPIRPDQLCSLLGGICTGYFAEKPQGDKQGYEKEEETIQKCIY